MGSSVMLFIFHSAFAENELSISSSEYEVGLEVHTPDII
jgi:hypothetical protein